MPLPEITVSFKYTNHRGMTAHRVVRPIRLWEGTTPWHPESELLLRAFDIEKQQERDFAMKDIPPDVQTTIRLLLGYQEPHQRVASREGLV